MSDDLDTIAGAPPVATAKAQKGSLNDLLATFGSTSDQAVDQTFQAKLPKGRTLLCRKVTDAETMESLSRRSLRWAEEMAVKEPGEWVDTWRDYWTDNKTVLAKVFVLSELCLEDDFKHNQLHCLMLARCAGPVFNSILDQISMASSNMLEDEAKELIEAGNA